MQREILNKVIDKILEKPLRATLCAAMGTASILGVSAETAAASTPKPQVATEHLFEAHGNIQCEDGAAVTGVWVESIPDSGWAKFAKIGKSSVYAYAIITSDPLYTVHVGCGGTPKNWKYVDYSHIETVYGENSFLCYTSPNPDKIPEARCEKDPALNGVS